MKDQFSRIQRETGSLEISLAQTGYNDRHRQAPLRDLARSEQALRGVDARPQFETQPRDTLAQGPPVLPPRPTTASRNPITSIALAYTPKFTISRTSLEFHDHPSFVERSSLAPMLNEVARGVAFVIGDWLLYGKGRFGEAQNRGTGQGERTSGRPRRL